MLLLILILKIKQSWCYGNKYWINLIYVNYFWPLFKRSGTSNYIIIYRRNWHESSFPLFTFKEVTIRTWGFERSSFISAETMSLLRCPFLARQPMSLLRTKGTSLVNFARKCPVMSRVLNSVQPAVQLHTSGRGEIDLFDIA